MRAKFLLVVGIAVVLGLYGCAYLSKAPQKELKVSREEQARQFYEKAREYQEADQLDSAVIAFRKAIALDPKYTEAHRDYVYLMRYSLRLQDSVQAEYQRKVQQDSTNEVYHYILSILFDDLDKKRQEAQKALALNPQYAWAYLPLAWAYRQEGKPEKAIKMYQQALALEPDFQIAKSYMASTYSEMGRYEEANRIYYELIREDTSFVYLYTSIWRNQLKAHPDDPEVENAILAKIDSLLSLKKPPINLLSSAIYFCRFDLKDEEKAREIEDYILRVAPSSLHVEFIVYNRIWGAKSDSMRIERLKEYLKRYPKGRLRKLAYRSIFNLTRKNPQLGGEKAAIYWGERWVQEFPRDPDAYNSLAWYIYIRHDSTVDKGIAYAKKGVEYARPYQKGYIMDTLGWAYFKKGLYAEALSTMVETMKYYDEPSGEVLFHLGAAYGKNGHLDKALGTIAQALTLDPLEEAEQYFREFYREKFGSEEGWDTYLFKVQMDSALAHAKSAPDFHLVALNGDSIRLSDLQGKVILLNFWGPG